jgi:dienelactone hydrolase
MKMKPVTLMSMLLAFTSFISCTNNSTANPDPGTDTLKSAAPNIREDSVNYTEGGKNFRGFVVYDENKTGKRPAVLVVHEWWGLNNYPRARAKQLAEMGYIAMAVDMFGDGKIAANPQEAQSLAMPFYKDPTLTKTRLDAALTELKKYSQVDTSNIAAIGYCYGGFVVLNAAKLGGDYKGVVSFHGNLTGVPARKDLLKAKILVCHGEADKFVSQQEVDQFKKSMDSIGADYTFKSYPNATHAFTNPDATETGKKFNMPIEYNPAADKASWKDMEDFFDRVLKK